MAEPTILVPELAGRHNADLGRSAARLERAKSYRDCSTVCVTPAVAPVPVRVVQSWTALMKPMNQRFGHLMVEDMEVGAAYTHAVNLVLAHPELSRWKYLLALETDNAPPPDGLLKLIEDLESGPWAAVGGLYWTKGEGGMPMCYGRPHDFPRNCIPWLPPPDSVTECNGLGMGFTLFKMETFKHPGMPKPLFETRQRYTPGVGCEGFTQDLLFFQEAAKLGFRFACSTRVLVGHWDQNTRTMW